MPVKNNLSNKVIWLTGGSSGIGLALLHKLLLADAIVIVTGRNIDSLQSLAEQHLDRLILIRSDFSKDQDLIELKHQFADKMKSNSLKSIDMLILNAGVCEYVDVNHLDLSLFQRMMQINFNAAVACCEIALPHLKASQHKSLVVGISSLVTRLPFTQAQAYGASKAAFNYFLESLRIDMKGTIDVTVVSPGFVKTPLTDQNTFPMPFLVSAGRAADEILKAIEKRPWCRAFPKRFALLLSVMSRFPKVWFGISQKMNHVP